MKFEPRDVVVLVLASTVLILPLAIIVALGIVGREITAIAGEVVQAVLVAILAVIASYVAGKSTK